MNIKEYISSGIIEDYVLGNISPEDSSILECVVKNNLEVRTAVIEYQQIIEELATKTAIQPPEKVKAELLKKIDFSIQKEEEGRIIPLNTAPQTQKLELHFPLWVKVASVAVLFGLGFMGYEVNSKNNELQQLATNNTQLATKVSGLEEMNTVLKNSKRIELKGVEKHPDMLAEVYWDQSKKVYLDIKNLPAAPTGKQYQLWAIVEGKPVDLGMYDGKNSVAIQNMKAVENPQAFAITLEKEGGNATPTMEEMYVMGEI